MKKDKITYEIKIEKDIPVTPIGQVGKYAHVAGKMEDGDSVSLPNQREAQLMTNALRHKNSRGYIAVQRKQKDGTYRVWKLKDKNPDQDRRKFFHGEKYKLSNFGIASKKQVVKIVSTEECSVDECPVDNNILKKVDEQNFNYSLQKNMATRDPHNRWNRGTTYSGGLSKTWDKMGNPAPLDFED
tara:strand:+ start:1174 stop:1728 length:555 start_codon:yes stop_codon:yes gene_type:complete